MLGLKEQKHHHNIHIQYIHQVELCDDRGLLLDLSELVVLVDDVGALFRGATFLDGGRGRGLLLPVARPISPHTWLVRLAERLRDRHQLALK